MIRCALRVIWWITDHVDWSLELCRSQKVAHWKPWRDSMTVPNFLYADFWWTTICTTVQINCMIVQQTLWQNLHLHFFYFFGLELFWATSLKNLLDTILGFQTLFWDEFEENGLGFLIILPLLVKLSLFVCLYFFHGYLWEVFFFFWDWELPL